MVIRSNTLKKLKKLLTSICAIVFCVNVTTAMDYVTRISTGILDKYKTGWTCLRDLNSFASALDWYCAPADDDRSSEESDLEVLSNEEKALLAEQTVNEAYMRTTKSIKDEKLMLSMLFYGTFSDHPIGAIFADLLKKNLVTMNVKDCDKDDVLKKALWSVMLDAMKNTRGDAKPHSNLGLVISIKYFNMCTPDEKSDAIKIMKSLGFNDIIPFEYRY